MKSMKTLETGPLEGQTSITNLETEVGQTSTTKLETEVAELRATLETVTKPSGIKWTNVLLISLILVMVSVLAMLVALFVTVSGMWSQSAGGLEKVNVVANALIDTETGKIMLSNLMGDWNFFNTFIDMINPMGVMLSVIQMDVKSVAETMGTLYDNVNDMYQKRRAEYESLYACNCSQRDSWLSGADGVSAGMRVMRVIGKDSGNNMMNSDPSCIDNKQYPFGGGYDYGFKYYSCGLDAKWHDDCYEVQFAANQKVFWNTYKQNGSPMQVEAVILDVQPETQCDSGCCGSLYYDIEYWLADAQWQGGQGQVVSVFDENGEAMAVVNFDGNDVNVKASELLYLETGNMPPLNMDRDGCAGHVPGYKCSWDLRPSYDANGNYKEEPMAQIGSVLEMLASVPMKPFVTEFVRAADESGMEAPKDAIRVNIDKWFEEGKMHDLGQTCLKWLDTLEVWDWDNVFEFDDPVSGEKKHTFTFRFDKLVQNADKSRTDYQYVWGDDWPEGEKDSFYKFGTENVPIIPWGRKICTELVEGFAAYGAGDDQPPSTIPSDSKYQGGCKEIERVKACEKNKKKMGCVWTNNSGKGKYCEFSQAVWDNRKAKTSFDAVG